MAAPPLQYADVSAEGRVAYEDLGGPGPVVICSPGLGDLRSQYRFLAPLLSAEGFRPVLTDLRGHGDSDATFSAYNGEEVGKDLVALARHLAAGPVVIVGNSLSAGAAVYAAAEAPDLVVAVVTVGGFHRGPDMNLAMLLLIRLLMATPLRSAIWMSFYKGLFVTKPADYAEHADLLKASMQDRARSLAFSEMMLSNHKYSEARLAQVKAPVLVVMGESDPDFPDPRREGEEVAALMSRGKAEVVAKAGHYPHTEQPDAVAALVIPFIREATGWTKAEAAVSKVGCAP